MVCQCGSSNTETENSALICLDCGTVLEESIIVSEVTFEEDGHGGSSAVGQFVSSESRGGGTGAQLPFHANTKESREVTLRNAKRRIIVMAQQIRLNQHCVDVAYNFFKMALHKQLTKGRKHSLTIAACLYITCRLEGTPHLLIDFSDIVQMDVFSLGRAFLQISRGLFINIPAVDPCLYLVRFAHKLNLGDKTHDVSMTALRLVQRMKRDWIHFGRRPSGVCGAALLIAARLHSFSRTVHDIINIVKVHETTLRKRLMEFGETPSSSLTMDEFLSVDLEDEHDPPSFKAARLKDREDLQKLLEVVEPNELSDMQMKIETELDKRKKKVLNQVKGATVLGIESPDKGSIIGKLIVENSQDTISEIVENEENENERDSDTCSIASSSVASCVSSICKKEKSDKIIKKEKKELSVKSVKTEPKDDKKLIKKEPSTSYGKGMELVLYEGPKNSLFDKLEVNEEQDVDGELDMDGIDDDEIDRYIMDPVEVTKKTKLWEELNSEYINTQKRKAEQLEKDIAEGKVEKKKRKASKATFHKAKSANDAIKIMLTEKKVSRKINYDVLNTLSILIPSSSSSMNESSNSNLPLAITSTAANNP